MYSTESSNPGPKPDSLNLLRTQRDQAVACAWLSLMISIALFISNFSDHSSIINEIRQTVEFHRRMLSEEESNLHNNQAVLAQTRKALENVRRAIPRSQP
jgi:hypothetical protein